MATGTQTADEEFMKEALSFFFDGNIKRAPTTGGVNNICNYVETSDGKRYILRIYNNGKNSPRVRFEHEVLDRLSQQQQLSFQIPRSLQSKDGKSHVLLTNGAEACVFHVIPGTLPKTTSPKHIGRASGELNSALSKVQIESFEGCAPPYYDLYKVHHAITREIFMQEILSSHFDVCREAITFLVEQICALEKQLVNFQEKNLPKQLIHGDLHYDNVLVGDDDKVTGLLDFEFCAYDWRAMELAICLSKYASEKEPLPLFQSFIEGYMEHGRLTDPEIDMIPDLINLRILSNVVYFVGRAVAKEDTHECLTSRAQSYAKRVRWINDNKLAIVGAIREAAKASLP